MSYTKFYTGGSFSPGTAFPKNRCYFENCTFQAACTFGDHCDFINCTFVKCCPKAYSNQSKTGEHCRFFKCKLESVSVGPYAELYDTNKSGYLVTVQQPMPLTNKTEIRGNAEKIESTTAVVCGQRINSVESKTACEFYSCKPVAEGESDSNVEVLNCGE